MKADVEGETSSCTTHHLVKMLKPILSNNPYTYWINILVEIIKVRRYSMVTLSNLLLLHG